MLVHRSASPTNIQIWTKQADTPPGPGTLHRLHELHPIVARDSRNLDGNPDPQGSTCKTRVSYIQERNGHEATMGPRAGQIHLAIFGTVSRDRRVHTELQDPQRYQPSHPFLLPPHQLLSEPPPLRQVCGHRPAQGPPEKRRRY
jgi:hypothetical protein